MTRLKVAELTSGVGALVLGVGLGALFPQWFAPAAGVIALAGVVAHAFGMWGKAPVEGSGARAKRAVGNDPVLGLPAAASGHDVLDRKGCASAQARRRVPCMIAAFH